MKRILPLLLLCATAFGATIPISVDKTTKVLATPTNAWTANKAGITAAVLDTPTTSSSVAGWLTDETGSGSLVFSASPTFTGAVQFADGSAAAPSIRFGDADTGLYQAAVDRVYVACAGTAVGYFNSTALRLVDGTAAAPSHGFTASTSSGMFHAGSGVLGFSVTGSKVAQFAAGDVLSFGSSSDASIRRREAQHLMVGPSSTAKVTIANTDDLGANYEWGGIWWSGNEFSVGSQAGGTATKRALRLEGNAITIRPLSASTSSAWQFQNSGHFVASTDNTYDIGASGATRPRTGYFGTDVNAGGAITATGNLIGARLLVTSAVGASSYIRFGTSPNNAYMVGAAVDTLQIGAGGGTPTPQTLRGPYAAGTDVAGGALTIEGGQNTGSGRGGDVVHRTANSGASGASLGTLSTRRYDSAKWVDLTESTDSQIATVACGTGKYAGAQLVVTVNAADASDFQALTSTVTVSAVNKAGTITRTVTQVDGTTAASAGTLTATYVVTDNGSGVLGIKVNAVSSLSQTQLRAKWSIVALNSDDAATVTPN